MEEVSEPPTGWETILSSLWFFSGLGHLLSFGELHQLCAVSRRCRERVLAWLPQDLHQLVLQKQPRLLMFGVHGCSKVPKPGVLVCENLSWYRNPAPIVEFVFDALAVDGKDTTRLTGRPWSEVGVSGNQQPDGLGRSGAAICAANDTGSKIFYCGGRLSAARGADRWVKVNTMRVVTSDVAAIFDVATSSWKQVTRMPLGLHESGVCRIGSRIYLIGGEYNTQNLGDDFHSSRSVLCFDLASEEWIDTGIPDYPGQAYCYFAVVATDESTIFVAGGISFIRDWHHGPIAGTSREVFSLDIRSGLWTRLADLSESVAEEVHFSGFLIKDDNGETSFAVKCGRKCANLLPNGQWQVHTQDFRERNGCFAAKSDGSWIVSFSKFRNEFRALGSDITRVLPPENGISEFGLKFTDSHGDPVVALFGVSDTIVEVKNLLE